MITSDRMAAVDRNAAALGVTRKQLMESSGNAVARAVRSVADAGDAIAIVAGRGNNGGDAFVAARFLDGFEPAVHLIGRPESITTEIARANWAALEAAEVDTTVVADSRDFSIGEPDVIVDGMVGTGVVGPPREPERSAIEAINDDGAIVVSVDVPSGLDADTGSGPGPVVEADRVVTFHDEKPGLEAYDGVTVADIGIPVAAERFVGPGDLLGLERADQSHKGDHGRVMVIGGGPFAGAPALTALAALRGGADLAFVAAPTSVAPEIQGFSPDLIVEPLATDRFTADAVPGLLDRAASRDVVVIGPGLGDADETRSAVAEFLHGYDGRAVVDADALQAVPAAETRATLVCTPHQGELHEMGGPTATDWRERAPLVAEFAAELGHTLLVKGRYDVISDGTVTRINRTGNPGMTVGGTGDVLAGVTAAVLVGQPPATAAAIAAYVTGSAGDAVAAAGGYGLLASDLLDRIPPAMWGERDG